MRPNRIVLKAVLERHDEGTATTAISPGHLCKRVSPNDGGRQSLAFHNVVGGRHERIFAKEDAHQGRNIETAYAEDDIVMVNHCFPGDTVLARLPANAEAVAVDDVLISAGNGCLKKRNGSFNSLYRNVANSTSIVAADTNPAEYDKSITLPANFLQVGDVLRIRGRVYVESVNSTNTILITLKIGTTTIKATAAVAGAVGNVAYIDAVVVIRTIGASGTFVADGVQGNGVPGTATALPWGLESTAIDTTAAQKIAVTNTWSAANASNISHLTDLVVSLDRGQEPVAIAEEVVDNSAGASEAFVRVRVV